MINIDNEYQETCLNILNKISNTARLKKKEFALIDDITNWFLNPTEDFSFMVSVNLNRNGESINSDFSFNGSCFSISETHSTYETSVGGDNFTSYSYEKSPEFVEENGELYAWENTINDILNYADNDDCQVDICISEEL